MVKIFNVEDQFEYLLNIILKDGIDSLKLKSEYRAFCMYWLNLGAVSEKDLELEYSNLKKNYDWVCDRLTQLEKNEKPV